MSKAFKLQDPGEGIKEAEILDIVVSEGDRVSEGDHVLDAETDKSAVEIRADFSGTIEGIKVKKGAVARVGDVLLTYRSQDVANDQEEDAEEGDSGEGSEENRGKDQASGEEKVEKAGPEGKRSRQVDEEGEEKEPADAKEDEAQDAKEDAAQDADEDDAEGMDETPSEGGAGKRASEKAARAAPSTRRLAREKDVDMDQLTPGSGPGGRVMDEDVLVAAGESPPDEKGPRQPSERRAEGAQKSRPEGPSQAGSETEEARALIVGATVAGRKSLGGIRRATARRMVTSASEIPQVMHHDVAVIDELETLRRQHGDVIEDDTARPTLTCYLIKSLAAALRKYPNFNARYDADKNEVILLSSRHIGVAVATERGLFVPVVRDPASMSLRELSQELHRLSDLARSAKLQREDMAGASMTLTNVGGIGGRSFTPLINPPESAILGVGASYSSFSPDPSDGHPRAVTLLPLSFVFDHRLNDGAEAAHFVNFLRESLKSAAAFTSMV